MYDPISFDMEYTRDLGYCAAQFLLDGGTAAMVSIQNGRFIPIPFGEILIRRLAALACGWWISVRIIRHRQAIHDPLVSED